MEPLRVLELFSGTGSIGRAFKARGHLVTSLDCDPMCRADITVDVLQWDYAAHAPPGTYDVIWASPPCTEYSQAKTTAPRNLELADSIVERLQAILDYFQPKVYLVENPAGGLMASRAVTQRLNEAGSVVVSYCMYAYLYRKNTRIWHSPNLQWTPRPPCNRKCPAMAPDGRRHQKTAQRGPGSLSRLRGRRSDDRFSVSELHTIPPELCAEMARACELTLSAPASP